MVNRSGIEKSPARTTVTVTVMSNIEYVTLEVADPAAFEAALRAGLAPVAGQPGVADLDPAVVQEVRDTLAQMLAGNFTRFDVFKGPINDNKGNVVLPEGQSLEQVDLDAFPEFGLPCSIDVCMKWWAEGITAELPE